MGSCERRMLVTSTRENRQGAPLGARKMVQVAPRRPQVFGGNPRLFRGSKCTLRRVRIAPFVVYFTPRYSRAFSVICGATALRLAAYRVHVNIPLRRHPIFFRLCPGNLPFSCHSGGMRAERRSSETSPKGPELLDMFRFGEQIAITAPKLIARSEQRSMTQ